MNERTIPLSIAADHPAYAGHFPGRPVLPGVVLLDAVLHALTVQLGRQAMPGQIKAAKFLSPVRPGESLTLHYSAESAGGFRFEIRCPEQGGERSVASGAVVFSAASAA